MYKQGRLCPEYLVENADFPAFICLTCLIENVILFMVLRLKQMKIYTKAAPKGLMSQGIHRAHHHNKLVWLGRTVNILHTLLMLPWLGQKLNT